MDLDPKGVEHEISFWRDFVQTERFQGWVRNERTPELNQTVADFLLHKCSMPDGGDFGPSPIYVLDVGSGPVSILRGLHPRLEIDTADPLSSLYQEAFDYVGNFVNPPYPFGAEELDQLGCLYDVVHISNALDHTSDPSLALSQLAGRLASRGILIVQGFVDEARHENWAGFHQHNLGLTPVGRKLYIDSRNPRGMHHNGPRDEVAAGDLGCVVLHSETQKLWSNKDWFIWILQKIK